MKLLFSTIRQYLCTPEEEIDIKNKIKKKLLLRLRTRIQIWIRPPAEKIFETIQWGCDEGSRCLVGGTIWQRRMCTSWGKPFRTGKRTSQAVTLLCCDGRFQFDQIKSLFGVNVGCQIIHQVGDGGDEAWVGAMKILEDFKLLFDLQGIFFSSRLTLIEDKALYGIGITHLLMGVGMKILLLFVYYWIITNILFHRRE